MKKHALLITCLFLAAPALAQSLGEKTGADSVLGVAPSTADFVTEVANSDKFEIASSKLAEQKADPSTKSFAAQMIADHSKTSKQLKALVKAGTVQAVLPDQLDASHQTMLGDLTALNGNDFSSKYRDEQVTAHKDAVSLFQRYAKGGDNPELKAWAEKTLPTLQHHLEMAENLTKS